MNGHDPDAALSQLAGAIAEPARTKMLCALMDGHARTSTEMAVIAGVSASTASVHLARLKEQGLITLHTQGRHRYYRLTGPHIAQAIEGLMVISRHSTKTFVPNTPSRLQFARTCYDHMAGTLAVQLHDHFIEAGWLIGDGTYQLSLSGEKAMIELGVDVAALRAHRRRFACACLDWSVRRPHLAGALGAALLQSAIRREWVTQDLDSRALGLTPRGRKAFASRLGIEA